MAWKLKNIILQYLRFSQRFCWGFKFSGRWHCCVEWVVSGWGFKFSGRWHLCVEWVVHGLRIQVFWEVTVLCWVSGSWAEDSSFLGGVTVVLSEWFVGWGFKLSGRCHCCVEWVVCGLRIHVVWEMTLLCWVSGLWAEDSSCLGGDTVVLSEWFVGWGFKFFGRWHCCVEWVVCGQRIQVVWEVTLLCWVSGSWHFKRTCCLQVLWLLTLECEDDMILQNIRNHSPSDTTSHSRTLESMGKDLCIPYKQNCAVLVCCEESFAFT